MVRKFVPTSWTILQEIGKYEDIKLFNFSVDNLVIVPRVYLRKLAENGYGSRRESRSSCARFDALVCRPTGESLAFSRSSETSRHDRVCANSYTNSPMNSAIDEDLVADNRWTTSHDRGLVRMIRER